MIGRIVRRNACPRGAALHLCKTAGDYAAFGLAAGNRDAEIIEQQPLDRDARCIGKLAVVELVKVVGKLGGNGCAHDGP